MRVLSLLLLWVSLAIAQVVPGVYIVELQGPPGASFASKDNRRAVAQDRLARINAEQAAVRRRARSWYSDLDCCCRPI